MDPQVVAYNQVRGQMQAGDVIAFGGTNFVSELIKFVNKSPVSHVAVIMQTKALYDDSEEARFFNEIAEASQFQGYVGVGRTRLSDQLRGYTGQVWWLPLNRQLCQDRHFSVSALFNFLYDQQGKGYDWLQSVGCNFTPMQNLLAKLQPSGDPENFSRYMCSELVAAALEESGLVGKVNAGGVSPIELCRWNIYEPVYYQIYLETAPKLVAIPGFNRREPYA